MNRNTAMFLFHWHLQFCRFTLLHCCIYIWVTESHLSSCVSSVVPEQPPDFQSEAPWLQLKLLSSGQAAGSALLSDNQNIQHCITDQGWTFKQKANNKTKWGAIIRVVPIMQPVSEMPPVLSRMLFWVGQYTSQWTDSISVNSFISSTQLPDHLYEPWQNFYQTRSKYP